MISTDPPPIPACHIGEQWGHAEHLLLWVHTGRARLSLETGQEYRLSAREGLWAPAGIGRRIITDPGTLAFPAWVARDSVPLAPRHPVAFSIADEWRDWLIQHYVRMVAPITNVGYAPTELLDLLGSSDPSPRHSRSGTEAESGHQPPTPRGVAARAVAQELRRNPALDHTVEQWAALAACSPSTLRREFLSDTGMSFAQWRALCRLSAAREFLAAGYDVGQVAARTGFESRNGFTRAFRTHYRVTPRDYAAQATAQTGVLSSQRVMADRQTGALARMLDGPTAAHELPTASRPLPVTHTAPRVNDFHVLTWIYRGTGYARVGDATYPRKKGDAIWLPAGVENETGSPENSLGMPLGNLYTDDVNLTEPLRAHFPASWDTYLLHCSVTAYTILKPENYDHRHILDIFREQLAVERARSVPMPKDVRARAVATEFIRQMGTHAETTSFDLTGDVHQAFRRETGMSFASWQYAARMRIARNLLTNGAKPSVVASRVGYTQVSNFSRAFARFHGVPPREYQERELGTV